MLVSGKLFIRLFGKAKRASFGTVCNLILLGISFFSNGMTLNVVMLYKAAAVLCFGAVGGYLGMLAAEHASKLKS